MEAIIRRGAGFGLAFAAFLLSRKRSRASGAPALTVVVAGKSKSHFEVGGARASGVGNVASSSGGSQQRTSDPSIQDFLWSGLEGETLRKVGHPDPGSDMLAASVAVPASSACGVELAASACGLCGGRFASRNEL